MATAFVPGLPPPGSIAGLDFILNRGPLSPERGKEGRLNKGGIGNL